MAMWDSADCVRRAKLRLARPSTDSAFTESTTDDVWYDFASEAQDRVNRQLAIFVPDAVWTVPTEISSADGGYTYTFGTDVDTEAIFAFGHFKLFENLESIPDYPLEPGVDFTIEGTNTADKGTVIRIPANATRTFADGGPYAQYVAPSNVITSSTQPTIPKFARTCLVTDTEKRAWERLGMGGKADEAEERFQDEWIDILASIRTQAAKKTGAVLRNRPRSYVRRGRWSGF